MMELSSGNNQIASGTQGIDDAAITPRGKRTRLSRGSKTDSDDQGSTKRLRTGKSKQKRPSEEEPNASVPAIPSGSSAAAKPTMSQLGTKKSRKGCVRCKQRRVKCDENTPCGNCFRRNEECSLLEPSPTGSPHPLEPGLPTTSLEWTQDLELMHHYSTETSMFRMGVRDDTKQIWATYVPQQAIKYPFVMHGLLATSALHLAYLNRYQSSHYLQLCNKHQTVALREYRTLLDSNINAENADALFILASIICVTTMARACEEAEVADIPRTMSIESITEFFFLTRGVRDVIHAAYEYIQAGPMVAIFDAQRIPEDETVILPPEVVQQFLAINQLLDTWGLDPEALTHCRTALNELIDNVYKAITFFAPKEMVTTGTVWRWPINVPTQFVRLVSACNPPALVIFMYFAAAVSAVRNTWYNEHWSEFAVNGVSLILDESMRHWAEWPRTQLKDRMGILGVTLPTDTGERPAFGT